MLSFIVGHFNMSDEGKAAKTQVRRIERERQALLRFKQGLEDHANILSSWTSSDEDCCSWRRIRCNDQTNHMLSCLIFILKLLTFLMVIVGFLRVVKSILPQQNCNIWNTWTSVSTISKGFQGSLVLFKGSYISIAHKIHSMELFPHNFKT